MKGANINILIYLLIIITINGCMPYLYVPNAINVPLYTEKNDITSQISVGPLTHDVQLSYAPTNNIGVMLNTSFKKGDVIGKNSDSYNSHLFIEGGVGYYAEIGEVNIETIIGYGNGESTVKGSDIDKIHYNRFFFQPSVGRISNMYEGAFSIRFSSVNIYKTLSQTGYSKNRLNAITVEPVLTGKFGDKFFKFFIQGGLSLPMYDYNLITEKLKVYNSFIIFNVGINMSIRKSYFDKESKSILYKIYN